MPGYSTRSSSSSRTSSRLDDVDAITPCLLPSTEDSSNVEDSNNHTNPSAAKANAINVDRDSFMRSRSSSPMSVSGSRNNSNRNTIADIGALIGAAASATTTTKAQRRNSLKTLEEGTDGDPERLWRRMLALQQIYGCYRSARMSAALELGDISLWQPSKACLDLMNEDMEILPDDAEEALKTAFS